MKIPKTQKLTNFKPLQDELLKLRADNKNLIEALSNLKNDFENLIETTSVKLGDTTLKNIEKAAELIKQAEQK